MLDAAKGYKRGTHRQVAPAETLARVKPFLARMGITRLANVTGLDTIGIPVVMACRPNSRSLAVAQGKGLDLDAARASAAMETIEAYHAENVRLPLRLATFEQLRESAAHVVDVDKLARTPDSAFHADLPLLWIEGDDWMHNQRVWTPFQIVHTNYTANMRFDLSSFYSSSTGLASGNHALEAVSHAICEVIERDADRMFARLPESEQDLMRVDLATVDDTDCQIVLACYERAGVAVAVWEITTEIGVPAYRAVIVDRSPDPLRPVCPAEGSGCHPARHIALLRALTEAAQSRLTTISGARDDMLRAQYERILEDWNVSALRARALLNGSRTFGQAPSFAADTFGDDVRWLLGRLSDAGLDRVIVFDLTLPPLNLPVVRVVIPGLDLPHQGNRSSRPPDAHA
jgi:ribosomal protein S12 methylthiotransferase accessory factor